MKILPILTAICLLANLAHSQERTAAGALNVQMTWTALNMIAEGAKYQAQIATVAANAALDETKKIATCGNKEMFYAPQKAVVDSEGCAINGGHSRWVTGYDINPHSWVGRGELLSRVHFTRRGIQACANNQQTAVRCTTKGSLCYIESSTPSFSCGSHGDCSETVFSLLKCD